MLKIDRDMDNAGRHGDAGTAKQMELPCLGGRMVYLEDAEIEATLAQHEPSPVSACEALIQMANDRGGKDNVTVLIAHVVGGSGADDRIDVIREYSVGDD